MKFYYDGVLICGAKTQKYKYAIVYPSGQERWVMHSTAATVRWPALRLCLNA